jgi:spermidine/putrescine transport system substrate-binding protein
MNFVYDPKIAAQISVGCSYISPVKGIREEAAKIDPKSLENPLIFPDEETLSNVVIFDAEAARNQDYIEKWQALLGA